MHAVNVICLPCKPSRICMRTIFKVSCTTEHIFWHNTFFFVVIINFCWITTDNKLFIDPWHWSSRATGLGVTAITIGSSDKNNASNNITTTIQLRLPAANFCDTIKSRPCSGNRVRHFEIIQSIAIDGRRHEPTHLWKPCITMNPAWNYYSDETNRT